MRSLSTSGQLLTFAILLPAAVAGTNQLVFESVRHHLWLRPWLYPWMAFTTAVLSWCAGRYLSPAPLRWIVFGWCLVLLDVLTIAACLDRRIEGHFGYVLVSAQISLLILWTILGDVAWQWKLPGALVATAVVIGFSGTFTDDWWSGAWGLMMIMTAAMVALLSAGLRYRGFLLRKSHGAAPLANHADIMYSSQFGMKHMLIWATAIVPLLLVMRGIDYFLFAYVTNLESTLAAILVAVSLATVHLVAIWLVLGAGSVLARMIAILLGPPMIAAGLMFYSSYLQAKYGNWPNIAILDALIDMRSHWFAWICLDAALLVALLLFLRAGGYRLASNVHTDDPLAA